MTTIRFNSYGVEYLLRRKPSGVMKNRTTWRLFAASLVLLAGNAPALAQQLDPQLRLDNPQVQQGPSATHLRPQFPAQNALPPAVEDVRRPPTAGTLQPGQTVIDRLRPELAPLGVRAGSFIISPTIETDATYNDNIF